MQNNKFAIIRMELKYKNGGYFMEQENNHTIYQYYQFIIIKDSV